MREREGIKMMWIEQGGKKCGLGLRSKRWVVDGAHGETC
jgi:hypothetical protein